MVPKLASHKTKYNEEIICYIPIDAPQIRMT